MYLPPPCPPPWEGRRLEKEVNIISINRASLFPCLSLTLALSLALSPYLALSLSLPPSHSSPSHQHILSIVLSRPSLKGGIDLKLLFLFFNHSMSVSAQKTSLICVCLRGPLLYIRCWINGFNMACVNASVVC